ncbi:four helix bundle protein [Lutibacter agarilyticus]|uniref:Four helix bundle protein n=1 Tax=Lutibacter agarilyticus TaxID=1109740 RepID=A0A238Y9H0_9FLAO|nr:four helix bundle protein [Lutibacter agarilyticus]SNR67787.1 four helix bundle protein [Lutibacter agarilyticus]
MRNFRKYQVWELGHQITLDVYKLTMSFPKNEQYGLTSQMKRASSSVPANIAEGCGRESEVEFKRFLVIANGSATELEYFLILVKDLNIVSEKDITNLVGKVDQLKRSLNKLISKINTTS